MLLRLVGGSSNPRMADDAIHHRLRVACVELGNALFDRAALANDGQFHARTLLWLRTLREHGDAIVASLQHDLSQSGTTLDGEILRHLLQRHFATLDPDVDESALLESIFSRQLLSDAPAAPASQPAGDDSTTRIIARLHPRPTASDTPASDGDDGRPSSPSDPDDTEITLPAQAAQPRSHWHTALLSVPALLLLIASGQPRSLTTPAPVVDMETPPPMTTPAVTPVETWTDAPRAMTATIGTATEGNAGDVSGDTGTAATQTAPIADEAAADTLATAEPGAAETTVPVLFETATVPTAMTATPAPQATRDPRLAAQVEFLLRRGDAALAALHLSEPFPDSAAANYAAALALDPGNSPALEGLERIVAAYERLVDHALAERNLSYADTLLKRARTVHPASERIARMDRDIATAHASAR